MPLNKPKDILVTEAEVYLVGVQQIKLFELNRFLEDEGFPDWSTSAHQPGEILPELAGRLCYMAFKSGRPHDEYIANIKRERHGSVLEHSVLNFILTGVSRSLTHELVRHRAGWGYSQLSQRFVSEVHARFVVPDVVNRLGGEVLGLFRGYVEASLQAYCALQAILKRALDAKFPATDLVGASARVKLVSTFAKLVNGAARSLLPNAAETKIFCTVNARAFRHFLEMRASQPADREIRALAMKMYRKALPYWPDILADYQVAVDEDGVEYLTTETAKV